MVLRPLWADQNSSIVHQIRIDNSTRNESAETAQGTGQPNHAITKGVGQGHKGAQTRRFVGGEAIDRGTGFAEFGDPATKQTV